ncbi:MAG: serine/threonine-protein kinase [Verrucomicrobiia bacterium]
MNARRICPQCGLELPAGSSSWLCPKCVLAKAATGEDNAGSEATVGDERPPRGDIADEALPRTLGNYQLLERIGEGGMGVVYRARQLPLDRIVAVKVLPFGQLANKEFVHRFRTEAVAAGSLQHPNIVGIHEVGLDEGQHYLVMEYVAGPTLAELARQGPLPARSAARYVQLIAEAVHFAHERNILHRDLKPSNVLIDANDQPRVMDFGLAKRLESGADLTLSGQVLGSPGYMPPEQASGERGLVGRRSDVYSLGAILYHLLTGRSPFVASELADTLRQVLNDEPIAPKLLNPKTPKDLETICLKCLEKSPRGGIRLRTLWRRNSDGSCVMNRSSRCPSAGSRRRGAGAAASRLWPPSGFRP